MTIRHVQYVGQGVGLKPLINIIIFTHLLIVYTDS